MALPVKRSQYEPKSLIRRDNLVQVLCSKINIVQIPAAHPSYYVSDGNSASIYSMFRGKLWELILSEDLLWKERADAGALHWKAEKFIDELIVSMKQGGMVFEDKPNFFFYYYDEQVVDFTSSENYPLTVSATLPQKFALMLRLIQPAQNAQPADAGAAGAVGAAGAAGAAGPKLFVPVRRKRKSKKQKVKNYVKIRKTKLRF